MKIITLLFAMLCPLCAAIAADTVPTNGFLTGQDWMNMYESRVNNNRLRAVFYLEGVADTIWVADRHHMLCVPNTLTGDTLSEIVHEWYIKNPTWRTDQASVGVSVAIMASLKCE